jgi:hypothetical protein
MRVRNQKRNKVVEDEDEIGLENEEKDRLLKKEKEILGERRIRG